MNSMHTAPISALYFDGKTSRAYRVLVSVDADVLFLHGDIERQSPLADLCVSERVAYAARKITFVDAAYLEVADQAIDALLLATGHQDSIVVRAQQSWRGALAATFAAIGVLVLAYLYALPLAANVVASLLPASVERSIGVGTLEVLDQHLFQPSQLPIAQQQSIIQSFQRLHPPIDNAPQYQIVFRKSRIGANAFALPSGQIVLTDELILLMPTEAELIGILAHELGHLHERHLTRRVIQSSVVAGAATLLWGDVSAVIANVPTLLLDLKYSRDIEREADDYAIALLKKNNLPLTGLVHAFEKLQKVSGDEPNAYLSSHPPSEERILRIQQSQR